MRIAYADPPYPGQSRIHYADHADYAGEVDHDALARRLQADYDGWIIHTSAPGLYEVQRALADAGAHALDPVTRRGGDYRVCVWVKTFAAFKANVPIPYAWEPVLIKPARKVVVDPHTLTRDWISAPITMRRGFAGAKPDVVVEWALRIAAAARDDDVVDLYPGSGAVGYAIDRWRVQGALDLA